MKVVDANILIYAVNADNEHHAASRAWLDRALGGADTVGFTWLALTAFLRLTTRVDLFPTPLDPASAIAVVRAWTTAPGARILEPTAEHLGVLKTLLNATGSGGNLVNDAHLAAIALEHRGDIVTYDSDFGRFPSVRWHRPDALLED